MKFKTLAQRNAERMNSPLSFKGEALPISNAPNNVRAVPMTAPKSYIPWTENKDFKAQEAELNKKSSQLSRYSKYFERAEELSKRSPILRQAQMKALNSQYGISDEESFNRFVGDYATLVSDTERLVKKYNLAADNEATRYKLWQSSLRPYAEVQSDIDALDKEISDLEIQRAKNVTDDSPFKSPMLKQSVPVTEEGKKTDREIASKLEEAKKRRKSLQQEKKDSQNYYYTNLTKKTDFSEKSKWDGKLDSFTVNRNKTTVDQGRDPEFYATDEEAAIYRYLKNTKGEDAAEEYSDYMRDTWNQRKAGKLVETTEAMPAVFEQLAKATQSFGAGVERYGQGVYSAITGKTVSPTAKQYAKQTYREKSNGIGKAVYDLSESIGNMAPGILLSAVTGSPTVGIVSIGASSGGNAYNEARKNGASKADAYAYGILVGTSEAMLGKALGGITALGGSSKLFSGKLGTAISAKINAIDKAYLAIASRFGSKFVTNGIQEGVEEGIQTILEPIFATMVLDEKYKPAELLDVGYSALLGFLSAGFLEGGNTTAEYFNAPLDQKVIDKYISDGEKAAENSLERAIADDIKSKLAANPNARITGFDVGRIARYYKDTRKAEKKANKELKKTLIETAEKETTSPTPAEAPATPQPEEQLTEFEEAAPVNDDTPDVTPEPVTNKPATPSEPTAKTTPTVSRDGIEIKTETDPEIQARLANAKDELERTGILSGASDTTINTVRRLSKLLKTDIRFEIVSEIAGKDGETYDQNGRYDRDDGIIYINMGSGTDTYTQIIAHEFTHSVEGTKLYAMLEKYAKENYKPQPGKADFDAEAVRILKRYRAANKDYDMLKAQAEVVANYVAKELLNNEANIERLVKENRTLAEKLKDIIDKVISVIGSEKAKAEAQTRVKLTRMSKLLNEALKTRDSNTDKSSNIKTRYNELVRKLQNNEITEEAYESQLSKLDSEASAMGIDLMNTEKDGESYSIVESFTDENGTYFKNAVLLDTDFFDDLSPRNWGNKLREYVIERSTNNPFILTVTDENGESQILQFAKVKDTVKKDNKAPHDVLNELIKTDDNISKLAVIHIDEIVSISEENNPYYTLENSHGWLDKHGWLHRNANVINQKNGKIYNVTLDIAKTEDGRILLYATKGKIKKVGQAKVNSLIKRGSTPHSNFYKSISQPSKKVNSKNDTNSYSITPQKNVEESPEESTNNSTSEATAEKGKQLLDHVRRNPKQERITKLFQKAYDNSKKKVVEHRLPRNSYVRMRDAEILLTREIADAFSTPFKRNGEYYHVIRDLVGEYVSTGKITQATLQEVARFLKVNFGVKITSSSMDILKYRIHKVVESDLKFVRETYEYMLEQANAEPVEVKQSRLEKGYRVVERRIHDFRKWLIDEMSINENQFEDIDELIYKMLSHSENGVIPSAYLNEFFNKIIYYTKHEKSKSVVELIDWLKSNFHIASSNKEALSEMTRILLTTVQNGKLSDSNITSFLNAVYSAGEVRSADVDLHLFFKNAKMSVDQHTIDRILESNEYDEFALSMLGDAGEGISVSDMYDYLHALRPELFPDDIFTEQEQAEYILSVAQESKPSNVSLDDTLSQEEKEHLFKRAKSKVSEVVSKFEGKKYSEIRSSINAYAVDLARDVMFATNYATDTASLTQAAMVESMDTETDKIEALYEKLKAERKKALSARGKTILRDKDQKALRALLSGEKTIEELSSDYNVKDIKTVYEASVEYERLKEQIGKYKEEVLHKRYEKADKILGDADISTGFRDHSAGMLYMMNTPERNIEWIGSRSVTSKNMIDAFIKPVHEAVRKMTIEKNDIVKKINDLDLSRKTAEGNTDSEAFAVQFVGEAEEAIRYLKRPMHNKERKGGLTLEEWEVLLNSFWLDNPNMDKDKIRKSIKVFREVYQKLFDEMNATRVRNGYEPVDYRGGYFPHFNPEAKDGLLSNFGKILGIDPKSDILPTEINGLTHIFRPNIPYMSSANARSENLQFETTYDAVEGMHRYLDSVLRVIHLTDSIGDLRALAQQIRYRASDEGRRESENMIRFRTDLDETQRQAAIDRIYEGGKYKLSNFVVDLEEYTNLLAGKKSKLDRTPEWAFGRGIYKLGKWISSRISANMIVANLSSALTNFIPLTIAISELPSEYIIRAASTAVAARHSDDGIESMSTFITNRKGADDLLKQWQLTRASSKFIEEHKNIAKLLNKAEPAFGKFTEIGMKPMELIDLGVSNVIVRAYYLYNVDQGMSETEALEAADDKARRIMADRSIGSMPTVFGATNPLVKLFTQFQLEVANQIAYFTHDVMQSDIPKADRDKKAKEIAIALIRYCIAAWLFNDLYEKLMGRRPALDPLGVFNDAVGDATGVHVPNLIDVIAYATNPIVEELFSTKSYYRDVPPWITQKMPFDNAVSNFTVEVLQETPFVGSLFGGGRLPAANALPDIGGALKTVISSATPQQKLKKVGDELSTVGTYFVLPGGGGQLSKTVKGIAAVAKSGKYTTDSKGREQLQYPITPSLFSVPKTLLFGPSSTSRGQEWIRTNFQNTLSWKETKAYDAMVDEGVTQDKAYDVVLDISNAGSKDIDKISALNNADIPDAVKRVAYEQLFLSGRSAREATLNALDNLGPYRDVVIDFMLEHPEVSSQEEIMNIWGDKFKSGRIIEGETSLSKREKAAILQTVVGNKTNPYWPELKESVYYVVHPDVKIEDEEKKRNKK